MKKIMGILLIFLFTSTIISGKPNDNNEEKSLSIGLGYCQQMFEFEDYLLLFYNPYISLNAEKKFKNINFLSFYTQNRIMIPSTYISNFEDLNNIVTQEKTFFKNPLSFESVVSMSFSKQIYDEIATFLNLGATININRYEFFQNKYSNLNFGFLIGWGYNYEYNENITFYFSANIIKYIHNIPFSGLYFNNALAQRDYFYGDNLDANISINIKY